MGKRDIQRMVEAARAQGCQAELTRGGHWRVTTPTGGLVFLPQSPSDWRAFRNARSQLRRAGIETCPHRLKKDQR